MSELDKEYRASCPVCKDGADRSNVKHTDCNCYIRVRISVLKAPIETDEGLDDAGDEDDWDWEDFNDEEDENEFVYAAEVQGTIPRSSK